MIDITKYLAYFHDGTLFDMQHINDEIELLLESSEMDLSDVEDDIKFSQFQTIRGKLHIHGIKSIQMDDIHLLGNLKMKYDSGNIFDLEIKKTE